MSKQANTVAIGAFVVGAMVILFSLIFYISGNAFRGNTEDAVLVFDGSVKGLKIGAPVAFKGVQIGEVIDIDLVVDTDTYDVIMPVTVRIQGDTIKKTGANQDDDSTKHLLDRGMRGQLQLQSLLTGLLYIQLDFFPDSKENYFSYETDLDQFPTIPTDLERISRNLQELDFGATFEGIENSITGLDKLINSNEMQALPGNLNQSLTAVEELSRRLKQEVDALSPTLNSLATHSDEAVVEFNEELPKLSASAQETLAEIDATLTALRTTLDNVDYVLSDDSAVLYDVRQAANELGAAGRALQSLAETLETQPESLLKGKSPLGN